MTRTWDRARAVRRRPDEFVRLPGRRRLIAWCGAVLAAAVLGGCRESATAALHVRFGASLPAGTRIEHFHCSGPGLDHADLWVLTPASEGVIARLVRGGQLVPRGAGQADGGALVGGWPTWWPAHRVDTLPVFHDDDEAAGARAHRRVWVDAAADRVYVQFFTT